MFAMITSAVPSVFGYLRVPSSLDPITKFPDSWPHLECKTLTHVLKAMLLPQGICDTPISTNTFEMFSYKLLHAVTDPGPRSLMRLRHTWSATSNLNASHHCHSTRCTIR